jgi:DNA-binding CsgD family transcriptional regulator
MTKSQAITDSDLRELFRIVGECREVGDDPIVWRQHLLGQTAKLIDADLVVGGEMAGCLKGPISTPGAAIHGVENGFDLAGLHIVWEWNLVDPYKSLIWKGIHQYLLNQPDPKITTGHHQLLSKDEWDRSPDFQEVMRTLGADAVIHSFHRITSEADVFEGICWFRGKGGKDFDDREIDLIHIIHERVARLVGSPLARFADPMPSQLSHRARNVLVCILEGDTDKEVSKRLSISPHTVNHYTKQIFSHFGVTSRTELLARWVRRGWSNQALWNSGNHSNELLIPYK